MSNNFFVDAKQRLLAKKSNSIWEKSPKGGMRLRCVRLFPTKFKKCIQLTKSCKLIEKFLFSTPFASRLLRSDTKHKLINVGLISTSSSLWSVAVLTSKIDIKKAHLTENQTLNINISILLEESLKEVITNLSFHLYWSSFTFRESRLWKVYRSVRMKANA